MAQPSLDIKKKQIEKTRYQNYQESLRLEGHEPIKLEISSESELKQSKEAIFRKYQIKASCYE